MIAVCPIFDFGCKAADLAICQDSVSEIKRMNRRGKTNDQSASFRRWFFFSCVCVINGDSGWRRIRSSHVRWLIVISADEEGLRCTRNAKFIALIRAHYNELKSPQTEADRSKRTLNKQRQRTEQSVGGCRKKSASSISIATAMSWSDRC